MSPCEGDGAVDGPESGRRGRDQVGRGARLRPRDRVRHHRVRRGHEGPREGDDTVDGPGAGHRQRDQVGRGALLRPRERVRHLRVRHDDAIGEPCEGDGASDGPVGPSSAWGDEAAGLLPFGTCASAIDTCGCDAAEPGVFGTTTASDGPGAAVRH